MALSDPSRGDTAYVDGSDLGNSLTRNVSMADKLRRRGALAAGTQQGIIEEEFEPGARACHNLLLAISSGWRCA